MIHKQGIPKRLFLNGKTSEDIVRHLVQQGLTKRITIVYQKHIKRQMHINMYVTGISMV